MDAAEEEEKGPASETAVDKTADPCEEDEVDQDGWLRLMGGAIRMRTISSGEGLQPEMKADAICSYEVRLASAGADSILQRWTNVRYRIGEGEAVPCLELGLRYMKQGEEAEIFGESRMAWGPLGLPAAADGELDIPGDADVIVRAVLHDCLPGESAEPTWNRQIQDIIWRKENGNDHFKRKQFQKAARCYTLGLQVFDGCFQTPDDLPNASSAAAMAMSMASDVGSNLAAVHLELGNPTAAKEAATAALELNPDHVKCLYRAAKACFLLDSFEECEAALQRALRQDPENLAVRRLEAEFKRKKQRYAERSKRVAASVFSGLQYPESSAAVAEVQDTEPEGIRAVLHSAVAWVRERRRYFAAGALCWVLAGGLCLVLPRRLWYYCLLLPAFGFPVAAGLASAHDESPQSKKEK